MRHVAWAICLPVLGLLAGCAGNSLVAKGQAQQLQQQQLAVSRQNDELHQRAVALDQDNQRLQSLLAQAQQRQQLLEDQLALVRQQLAGTADQLARLQQEKQQTEEKAQALTASLQRRMGVAIQPNNSLQASLPTFADPEVQVRRDGDVIRIELPADRLFIPGSANLLPQGSQLLSETAGTLVRDFPKQRIGIEGHTDGDPITLPQWRNHMHLSTAWAIAVYEALMHQTALRPEQLFVLGHGKNHPVVSNATAAGKYRNRRVELVIYPETVP